MGVGAKRVATLQLDAGSKLVEELLKLFVRCHARRPLYQFLITTARLLEQPVMLAVQSSEKGNLVFGTKLPVAVQHGPDLGQDGARDVGGLECLGVSKGDPARLPQLSSARKRAVGVLGIGNEKACIKTLRAVRRRDRSRKVVQMAQGWQLTLIEESLPLTTNARGNLSRHRETKPGFLPGLTHRGDSQSPCPMR